ncbi:MAG: Uma2 family endonuclease, partial [Bacteroidia bacterium]
PKIVIEVDTKADIKNFQNPFDYFYIKLEKLLNFGVEKVIWINTSTQTIVVAENIQQLNILKWQDALTILEDCTFCIKDLLAEEDFEI